MILLVEQNARQASMLCHRAHVLQTGRVIREGSGVELLNDPAVQEAYLGVRKNNLIMPSEVYLMPRVKLETHRDLQDFVRGCTLYGVGGGGNPAEGLKALEEQFEAGKTLGWVDPEDLPRDSWAACAFLMGSTAPLTEEKIKQKEALGLTQWRYPRNLAVTTHRLEEFTGRRISALIPLELGGSNTPAPVAAAASLGKLVVDGDFAGRAVPEITQTTAAVAGISFTPATSVDKYGNYCVIMEAISLELGERIGKYLSEVAFGSTGLCGFMVEASRVPQVVVRGTLTRALEAGRVIRRALEKGVPPYEALAAELGFYVLFKGKVVEKPWVDRDGYYWGTHLLDGEKEFSGSRARVVFKNENHLFYRDDRLVVSSPDLIMNMDAESGEPLRNEDIEVGHRIVLLGAPCDPLMRTEPALKYLGPRHFGADQDYVPIEIALAKGR